MAVKKKQDYTNKEFVKDIWQFSEGQRIRLVVGVTLRVIAGLAPFAVVFFVGKILDFFTLYNQGDSLTPFYTYIFLIGLLGSAQVWIRMIAKTHIDIVGGKARKQARTLAMSRLMDLELEWHEKENSGSKINKINRGSRLLYAFFANLLSNRGTSVATRIGGSVAIFAVLGLKYTLFAIGFTTLFILTEKYYNKRISTLQKKLNVIEDKVTGKIQESASNVLSVKSLGLRKSFEKSTQKHEDEYYAIWFESKKAGRSKSRTVKVIAAIGYALFLLMIGFDFIEGAITIGAILVISAYFENLRSALTEVSAVTSDYIVIKNGVGQLMTILGTEVFDRESDELKRVPSNWKEISFENIDFKYKNKRVLKNFSLIIKRGEKIGIVGKSGCGKSTLTKLLLGLYQPTKGTIAIDGVPIQQFKHSEITSTITAVLQDSEMFNATLEENITIVSGRKNKAQLVKATHIAALEEVIDRLPQRIKTLIGEKGYKVSGGERQRLGIARAVYKDSPMILLDEATSALDSKTEEKIQLALEENLSNKTLMIIAHRLSTLKHVDRIIVMEKGKITETGTFKELVKKKGTFYEMYTLQKAK